MPVLSEGCRGKGRSRGTSWEATTEIQAVYDGEPDWVVAAGWFCWSTSGSVLKVEPTGNAEGSDVGQERVRGWGMCFGSEQRENRAALS